MEPDAETIKRAQQGDEAAFAIVVAGCYDMLFRFSMKYTAQRADAEDISQQACIKLAQSIHLFRFESKFSSWLYQLVLNCARDWHRKNSKRESHFREGIFGNDDESDEMDCSGSNVAYRLVSNQAEQAIYLQQILGIVAAYGGEFLDTLVLVSGEGLSHAQAAQILNVKESTVSWRIHEIRKRLAASQMQGVE
ncbi:MAG: RNA polymerase sigma factor [Pseudomonadales bacterium]